MRTPSRLLGSGRMGDGELGRVSPEMMGGIPTGRAGIGARRAQAKCAREETDGRTEAGRTRPAVSVDAPRVAGHARCAMSGTVSQHEAGVAGEAYGGGGGTCAAGMEQ